MGGDDLCDDDQFLNPLINDITEEKEEEHFAESLQNEKKRKREEKSTDDEVVTKKSTMKLLINAGRDLQKEATDVQAKFLLTSVKHYLQMKGKAINESIKIEKSHLQISQGETMLDRLKNVVSIKKLKKWKTIGSPMVLIMCISARRAVAVLKELSALKIRAAKLFAKHMSIDQQREMLSGQSFGLAVGTPNRLLALCEEGERGVAELYLEKTTHVVLDTHVNQKGFTVCTLPDTAPDTMEFIEKRVIPEINKRKDIKLSFL